MTDRWIAHVDMDAFYASIEIRDDPSLAGKPVVVGGGADQRGVVSAASYEARKFGVHSAMPMARAIRLCPDLIRIPGDMLKYQSVSAELMDILHRYSPIVEPLSLDEAFLDLTGTGILFGSPQDSGSRIKAEIRAMTGLTASVGIAPRKFLAKIASDLRKPDGLVVVGQEDILSFLEPLPLARLWGVGPKTLESLRALGIETIGELAAYPADKLARRFGASGEHLAALARGSDERNVVPEWEAKSYSHEETFTHDQSDVDFLDSVLVDQAVRIARRLRRSGVRARCVTMKLRYGDFTTTTRQRTLSRATCYAEAIHGEAKTLFRTFWDGRPVRLLGTGASRIETGDTDPDLFTDPEVESRKRRLADAMDRLGERYGTDKLLRASTLPLHGEHRHGSGK
jgi:DNA polymerase-4